MSGHRERRSGRRTCAPAARPGGEPPRDVALTIEALGSDGDGIARLETRPGCRETVFLPLTLPGEVVSGRIARLRPGIWRGTVLERLAGPSHAAAACPHFGDCGGCRLQHVPRDRYLAFKTALVAEALARAGVEAGRMLPILASPPATRRRVRLAWQRRADGVQLGFRAARTNRIVPISACAVCLPSIEAAIVVLARAGRPGGPLDRLLEATAQGSGDIAITACETGLDILIGGAVLPGPSGLEAGAALADRLECARLALKTAARIEPIAERRPCVVRFGGCEVRLGPESFMQATAAGEDALRSFACAHLAGCNRILELFAGAGTFSLPLAASGKAVLAVDGDGAAIAALEDAARRAGLRGMLATEIRDLIAQPLDAPAIAAGRFDAVLLDPPRGGARAQVERLAGLPTIGTIVYLSCHPGSFARDAGMLAAAGWRLDCVQPIDQFVWSAEVELAGLFVR